CPGFYDDDDDDEYSIQYREYLENLSNAITLDLPTEEPGNSLSMGDKHLDTIPETESDEVIKSSVEDLVPIPSESEDTSGSDNLLVTPLFDVNEDECFDPGGDTDEIDAFLDIDTSMDINDGYHDLKGDIIYLESLLTNETTPSLPSVVFLDHDTKRLKDESVIDDSKNMVKIFDPGIPEKNFSPTYVSLPFEDRHYLFFTYVV
nr:hypothetical protein [Tanacetum cinerariifolium]